MKKSLALITLTVFCSVLFAQIPNAGFETWNNTNGYNIPDGWDNLNPMTASMSVYTCMKGTPGDPGTAYLKLVSANVSGMGVMPGAVTSGMFDFTTMNKPTPMGGFAFNQRPQSLAGNWQYMASGNDHGHVSVMLTKWNSAMMMRDTIATIGQALQSMEMSWIGFSLDLTYSSLEFPDTAYITFSASGPSPVAGSYLYLDSLQFTGSVAGVSGINDKKELLKNISLFPNPASEVLNVQFGEEINTSVTFQLIDNSGKMVKAETIGKVSAGTNHQLNVADIAKGNYLLQINSSAGSLTKNIVLQ